MDHKFNIGQGFEINVCVLVYHCLHLSWTHHCDIQVYIFIHSFKQRHVFFFLKIEILKKFHFHLNKISPLLWTLEPDFLWYLISFYKMWVYPTRFLNEYKDTIWFVVRGRRGTSLPKGPTNTCFEFPTLNNNRTRCDLLNIEVSFRVENAFRVAMLFGSSSSAEVLQIHMNCDVVVQHLFWLKTVAQTMVDRSNIHVF